MLKFTISRYTTVFSLFISLFSIPSWSSSYIEISSKALSAVSTKYGPSGKQSVESWVRMLNKIALNPEFTEGTKVLLANDYFNRVEWKWDIDHWGVEDYWATPIETLGTHAGDCEDFSIGKYFSLINMGFETGKLRITYVKALEYDLAHMVLAYYPTPNAEPLILDNINKTILPASKRKDLLPIYGFNGDGIWLSKTRKKLASGNKVGKSLPSWAKLTQRVRRELI